MSVHGRWRRLRVSAAAALAVGLLAAGCGGGSDSGGGSGASGDADTLVVFTGQAGDYQRNFNPYSPTKIEGPGSIFEPLFFYNIAAKTDPVPRLATEYSFNEDGTELSITLREGVTWSDGEDFTADDVKFTFDMLLENEALNTFGFNGETEVVDPTHVKVTFPEAWFLDGAQLLSKVWIVPEHIWSQIEDPASDTIAEPVGTGPYTVEDFKPQAFTLAANASYWDGEPAVQNVRYVALSGNQAGADALAAKQIDWQTGPVPNMDNVPEAYPGYDAITIPMNQMVLTSCANTELGCEGPQTDPAVRQAIYYAMNRDQLNSLAFQETASDVSPSFALPERDAAYISDDLENPVAPNEPDADRANEILTDAGYEMGSDGLYEKDGEKLSITVRVVTGWTDYITAVNTMAEQLKEAGIELIVQQASWNETMDARGRGDFQLLIDSLTPGSTPDPYWIYQNFFGSANTAPVGETANPNFSRYTNDTVDDAIDAIAQINPEDTEARLPYYETIQAEIERDMPYIPILTGGTTSEYHSDKFEGWPTEDNLYAFPAVWSSPDQSQIYMNLKPAGE
ncbi:ABC transporter substrate-binding protein [Streptomyces sp. RFCAC02]|uniref:ABC transporter substrate-binding protein n=1 Tax=Streptomyces sp. RFCAC02 TaxID=2499143 RepID=UPI00101E8FA5|nr:ABC transporter substrate-binding protein [Streptomyces sp. RFCAC02]